MKKLLGMVFVAMGWVAAAVAGIQAGDTVVFCGDSITCLGQMHPWGYRHQLTNALAQVRGVTDVKVVNLGFCGNGVANWLDIERNSKTMKVQANDHSRVTPDETVGDTFAHKVDVLVLSLGMNDMLCPFIEDEPGQIAKWLNDYRQLVRNLRARTKPREFVVCSIQPLTNDRASAKNMLEAKLDAGIRRIAADEGVRFADYHGELLATLEKIRARNAHYQDTPDCVHPRELGNIAMSMAFLRALGDMDLVGYLEARQLLRLQATVPQETAAKISYRVFPRNPDDVTSKERTYDIAWTRLADGVQGRTTVKLVPDKARNFVKVDCGEVMIPAPWRVSEPLKPGARLEDVKVWKTLCPTLDYVGGDDPGSVDYMQAWFGGKTDTFFATRRIYSAKPRALAFEMRTSAFSNTYAFGVSLNGAEVWSDTLPRGKTVTATRGVLNLKAGWNELVIRTDHREWQRQFALALLPAAGDTLDDLRYDATK